jgi:hypothetical protein
VIESEKTFVIPKNNFILAMLKVNVQKEWRKFILCRFDTLAYAGENAVGVIKFSMAEAGVVVCDIVCVRDSQEAETVYEQFCKLAEVKNGNSGTGRTVTSN